MLIFIPPPPPPLPPSLPLCLPPFLPPSLPPSRFPYSCIFFSIVRSSVSYPTIRSSGKDKTPDGHASLLGATVSLRCKLDHNVPAPTDRQQVLKPSRGEGPPSSLRTELAKCLGNVKVKDVLANSNTCSNSDEKSTSGCSSDQLRLFSGTGAGRCSTEVCMEACVQSGSDGYASARDSRGGEYGAVLGVKRRELRGHPVLYLRVSYNIKYAHVRTSRHLSYSGVLFALTTTGLFS